MCVWGWGGAYNFFSAHYSFSLFQVPDAYRGVPEFDGSGRRMATFMIYVRALNV